MRGKYNTNEEYFPKDSYIVLLLEVYIAQQFNHTSIQPYINSTIHQFNHTSIQPYINSIIHQFNHTLIQPYINLTIHQFNHKTI